MKRACAWALPFLAMLLASTARAGSDPSSARSQHGVQFEMDLGAGFAVPVTFSGQDYTAVPLSVLLRAEIGFRIAERTFVGLLGEYAPPASTIYYCNADPPTCLLDAGRLGLELQYHLGAVQEIHPWVGLAAGVELRHLFNDLDYYSPGSQTWRGWFVELQLGLEIPIGEVFRFGPWILFSFGTLDGDCCYGTNTRGRFGGGLRLGVVL